MVRGSRSSAFKREEFEPFVEHSRDLTERRAAHQYSISLGHTSDFVLYIKTHVEIQGLIRDSKYSRSRRVAGECPSLFFRTILRRYWVQARLDLPCSNGRGKALKHRRMHIKVRVCTTRCRVRDNVRRSYNAYASELRILRARYARLGLKLAKQTYSGTTARALLVQVCIKVPLKRAY